jgi:hypothetical protein
MMSNITVDGFCKMEHSSHNWWIKTRERFLRLEVLIPYGVVYKTVYFECEAVKSGRTLPTLPKKLLPQSSSPWRNVRKCDVICQEAVFWVKISATDEINMNCITYHCHFGEAVEFVQIARHSIVGCLYKHRSLSLRDSPGDPEDFVPAIWPASVPPSPPRTAEREMDPVVVYSIVNISCCSDNKNV